MVVISRSVVKKILKIFLFLCCTLAVFILLVYIILIGFFPRLSENDMISEGAPKEYKFLQVNNRKNEKSYGIVSSFRENEDQFFTLYENNEGDIIHELISKFDLTDYSCNGICYCKDEEGMDTSTTPPKTFLVATKTTFEAVKKAVGYFEKLCNKKYACPDDSITYSEVQKCEVLEDRDDEVPEDPLIVPISHNYICKGRCEENKNFVIQRFISLYKVFPDCTRPELELQVSVNPNANVVSRGSIWSVRNEFLKNMLSPFCSEVSQTNYDRWQEKSLIEMKWDDIGQVCIEDFDSINCVQYHKSPEIL